MRKALTICVAALLLTLAHTAHAQVKVGLRGGLTLPTGFYGCTQIKYVPQDWVFYDLDQTSYSVGASTGFSAGAYITYALPFYDDLAVIISADFVQNGLGAVVKNDLNRTSTGTYTNNDTYKKEYELPLLRNIPITLGARYSYPLGGVFDVFLEAAAGVNIRQITPQAINIENTRTDGVVDNESHTYTYDNAATFALRLGAGFEFNNMFTLGGYYSYLGKAPLSGEYLHKYTNHILGGVSEGLDRTNFNYQQVAPSMVTIQLGIHLNPFKRAPRMAQDF